MKSGTSWRLSETPERGARPRGRMRGIGLLLAPCLALCMALCLTLGACASGSGGAEAPTATPTTQQRLAGLTERAIGHLALRVTTVYASGAQTAQVTATVAWNADIAAAHANVKAICLRAQAALWTSGIALRKVSVLVLGPVIDDFGATTTDTYGVADLTATTAAPLNWSTLTADGAWSVYDGSYLRPTYRPNQMYGNP